MEIFTRQRVFALLTALLLAAVLATQSAQAAHVHHDHGFASDCLCYHSDTGQAALEMTWPASIPAADSAFPRPAVSLAFRGNAYHVPARGPPDFSC